MPTRQDGIENCDKAYYTITLVLVLLQFKIEWLSIEHGKELYNNFGFGFIFGRVEQLESNWFGFGLTTLN